jgi:hypothetical protein
VNQLNDVFTSQWTYINQLFIPLSSSTPMASLAWDRTIRTTQAGRTVMGEVSVWRLFFGYFIVYCCVEWTIASSF